MIKLSRAIALATGMSGAMLALQPAQAAVLLSGPAYSQSFDTLAATGTANDLTAAIGWTIAESGTNADNLYATDDGGFNGGNTYSYGADASADRALGSLGSGSLRTQFGAIFTNNLGATLSSIAIGYTGEQWRNGSSNADELTFEYSLNATSLTNGSWINVSSLDFESVITAATGQLDGNLAANRRALSGTIGGLSIANGGTFAIRWTDFDGAGAEDGLAVDNFVLAATPAAVAAVPEPASWAMMIAGFGLVGGTLRRRGGTPVRA